MKLVIAIQSDDNLADINPRLVADQALLFVRDLLANGGDFSVKIRDDDGNTIGSAVFESLS